MNFNFKSKLCFFFLASLLALEANAEEKNFGKSTPTTDNIIDEFKVPSAEQPDSGQTDENLPNGGKTRGLKTIGMGHTSAAKSNAKSGTSHAAAVDEKAISLEVLFDYNSANLTSDAKLQLVPVGGAMAAPELKGLHYRIEGHTDIVGGDEFNVDLSRRRAQAVKQFLVDQYGLSASAIEITGKGKNDLADPANPTSEVNRRVRIVRLVN